MWVPEIRPGSRIAALHRRRGSDVGGITIRLLDIITAIAAAAAVATIAAAIGGSRD